MKISRTGLVFAALYALPAGALFSLASLARDGKSDFVFKQIAVAPAMMVVDALGLHQVAMDTPWLNSFATMALLSLVLAYGSGHALGWLASRLFRQTT